MRGYPSRVVILDTESYPITSDEHPSDTVNRLRLGALLIIDPESPSNGVEQWHTFRTAVEMQEILDTMPVSGEPIYVFAHNMGYDVRQIGWFRGLATGRYSLLPPPETPGARRFKVVLFIAEAPTFIVRLFRADGQQFMLLDTVQWLQHKLMDVGTWIAEPKSERPAWEAPDDVWEAYCRQDVAILHRALVRLWAFLELHGQADWQFTPAAQSMAHWRRRFEKGRIVRPRDPSILSMDRHAYYKPLQECFCIGSVENMTHQIDVTSLYPAMMARHPFPVEVIGHGDYGGTGEVPEQFDPVGCSAEVWLSSDRHPFPVRGADGTFWARGRVRTVLSGPELAQAFAMVCVRRIGRWVRYRLDHLFGAYVAHWWRVRSTAARQGNRLGEVVAKSMLNRLHGKFAQRTGDWECVGQNYGAHVFAYGGAIGATAQEDRKLRILGGWEWHRCGDEEDPENFVPIASWTASYGRVFMWEMIERAGIDNVHYVGTDMLLLNGEGLGRLQLAGMVEDGQLGLFRHIGSAEQCTILGVNAYDFRGVRKRAGIKGGSVEVAPNVWRTEQWSTCADDLFHGEVESVTIRTRYVETPGSYGGRERLSDGRTVPHEIDNWHLSPEEQLDMPIRRRR